MSVSGHSSPTASAALPTELSRGKLQAALCPPAGPSHTLTAWLILTQRAKSENSKSDLLTCFKTQNHPFLVQRPKGEGGALG